jgi:hypothetical protein
MAKSEQMEKFLNNVSRDLFGSSRKDNMSKGECVCCGGAAKTFTDALSRKDYGITGLCQSCHDATYKEEGQ